MNRLFSGMAFVCGILISGIVAGQEIDWMHDLEAAQKTAAEQDKLVLLHFSADWCRPCKQLETFVFRSPLVVKALNEKVVPVHIDTDIHPELVKQFSIEEIPTDVVVTTKGRVVSKRKSPKDISNYVRMIKSLPLAGVANDMQNVEIAQKIEQVINANKKEFSRPDQNNFAAETPRHQQPAPSSNSMKLSAKAASTRQVDHETNSFVPRKAALDNGEQEKPTASPQRVINDKFFVEKSSTAEQSSNMPQTGEQSSNQTDQRRPMQLNPQPIESKQIASARINNPFQGENKVRITSDASAARIMTPNFDKERKLVAQQKPVATKPAATKRVAPNQVQQAPRRRVAPVKKISPDFKMDSDPKMREPEFASDATKVKAKVAMQPVTAEFALGGRCAVTLLKDGKWMKGASKFGCIHRGRVYIFGDDEKLKLFKTNPDKYSPVLAGYDPVEFHDSGTLVDGQEENGVFMGKSPEQKIVLFSSKETRAKFQASPHKYMSTTVSYTHLTLPTILLV